MFFPISCGEGEDSAAFTADQEESRALEAERFEPDPLTERERVELKEAIRYLNRERVSGDDYADSTELERAVAEAAAEAEAPTFVRNGYDAFSSAPEVVGLRVFRPNGAAAVDCAALTLSSRFILTAAHCFVPTCESCPSDCVEGRCEDLLQLDVALPPLYLPPPGRQGVATIRVLQTFGSGALEQEVEVYSGTASVIIHQSWNPDNATGVNNDPNDDIALVRTSSAMGSTVIRARLYSSTSALSESHIITGWRPIDEGSPFQEKTQGYMDFGTWSTTEGLKLNTPSTGVVGIDGDSGGGASVPRSLSPSGSARIYDGILSTKVDPPWPGNSAARIPYKLAWIENTASGRLGQAINFTSYTSASGTQYFRIGGTP